MKIFYENANNFNQPLTGISVLIFFLSLTLFISHHFPSVSSQDTLTDVGNLILGDISFYRGDYNGSIEYYDKVLAVDSSNTEAMAGKCASLTLLGNHEEAIALYDKVLAVNSSNTSALINKGVDLDGLGKHEEAIAYYDKVLAVDPGNTHALAAKEMALANLKGFRFK